MWGSCNGMNDSYAKLFVPDIIKKINVKVRVFAIVGKDGLKINADVNVKN